MDGHGLICAEGSLWKSQRKFVASAMRDRGMTNTGGTLENRIKTHEETLRFVNEFIRGKSQKPKIKKSLVKCKAYLVQKKIVGVVGKGNLLALGFVSGS